MALFDLKSLNAAFDELQQERGITRESVLNALETAIAAAYRREYGKRGQIIRATISPETVTWNSAKQRSSLTKPSFAKKTKRPRAMTTTAHDLILNSTSCSKTRAA